VAETRRLAAEQRELLRQDRTVVATRIQVQWNKCGDPTCGCASGELHGPYRYAIETMESGRRRKRYLPLGAPASSPASRRPRTPGKGARAR
jgi:hypothetical protein